MTIADYNTIQTDLKALLVTALTGTVHPRHVMTEAMDGEKRLDNMPYVDVSLSEHNPAVRAGQSYYGGVTFDLEVAAFDLSSYRKAATLRNEIVRTVTSAIRANPRFSADLETSTTDGAAFAKLESEQGKGFVAIAVVRVSCFVYEDR